MKIINKAICCILTFLLVACSKPVDMPTVMLEEYDVKYDIENYITIPKYICSEEEHYVQVLTTEPVDLSEHVGSIVEFSTF